MVFDEKKNNDLDEYEHREIILEKDFDGRCPYCGSSNVLSIGSHAAGSSSTGKLPSFSGIDWLCEECKKAFTII